MQAKTLSLSKEDSESIAINNFPTEFWKELIHVGTFFHPLEEFEFSVDEAQINHWNRCGGLMLSAGIDIPVPIEHTQDPEKRRGKIKEYMVKPNPDGLTALYGRVKFNDAKQAKQLSQCGVSIFVPEKIRDKHGRIFEHAIEHVAITDYPVINGLEGFQAIALSKVKPMPPVAPPTEEKETEEKAVETPVEKETKTATLQDIAKALGVSEQITDTQELLNAIYESVSTATPPAAPAAGETPPAAGVAPAAPPAAGVAPAAPQGGKVVAHIVKASKVEPALALSKNVVDQLREARKIQINNLATGENRKITPAVAKRLEMRFCSDAAIQLSNSIDGDGFKEAIADFAANETISVGSKTPPQAIALELSRSNIDENNPLLRDVDSRRKANGQN